MENIPKTEVTSNRLVPVNDAYLRGVSRFEMYQVSKLPYRAQIEYLSGTGKIMITKEIPTKTSKGSEVTPRDMIGTPLDRRLGTDKPRSHCATCDRDYYFCEGHDGYIPLPFFYPQYTHRRTLLKILNSFCLNPDCEHYGKVNIAPVDPNQVTFIDNHGNVVNLYSEQQMLYLQQWRNELIMKTRSSTPDILLTTVSEVKSACACVEKPKPWKLQGAESKSVKQDIKYSWLGRIVDPYNIREHLIVIDSNPYNRELFNVYDWMFQDLILSTIYVIPLSKRPDDYDPVTMKKTRNLLTNGYNKILKELSPVIRGTSSSYDRTQIMYMHYSMIHLVSKQKTSRKNVETTMRGHPDSSGLSEQIFTTREQAASGRTPISGRDPSKVFDQELNRYVIRGVDCVDVPYDIAKDMHITVTVNENNIEEVNSWLRKGLIKSYIPVGGVEMKVDPITVQIVKMDIGFIVNRRMKEGDWTIYTRQPILHSRGMRSSQVDITRHKTLGISNDVTEGYNADFDGDEMNLRIPGNIDAQAESISRYSMIGGVLPSAINQAGYGVNYVGKYAIKAINDEETLDVDVFFEAWEITPPAYKRTYFERLNRLTRPPRDILTHEETDQERLVIVTEEGVDVVEGGALSEADQERLNNLDERSLEYDLVEKQDDPTESNTIYTEYETEPYSQAYFINNGVTPNQLFSLFMPPNFNYQHGNLLIRDGIIIAGKIDTQHITVNTSSIHVSMYKQFDYVSSYVFINNISYILVIWMKKYGFTVGPGDLIPSDPVNIEKYRRGKESIITTVEDNLEKIRQYYEIDEDLVPADVTDLELFKQSIKSATRISGSTLALIDETFGEDDNLFYRMTKEKLSGNPGIFSQIVTPIGLAGNVEYMDIDRHSHDADLFDKIEFVKGSYAEGIDPSVIYHMQAEAREKAINKQIQVDVGGTFNYNLTSVLSTAFITDEGYIMTVNGNIIDDGYGVLGLADRKSSKVKNGNSMIFDIIDSQLLVNVVEEREEPPDVPQYLRYINIHIGGLLYYYRGLIVYGQVVPIDMENIRELAVLYNAELVEVYVGHKDVYGEVIETTDQAEIRAYERMDSLAREGIHYKMYDVSDMI